MSISFDATVGKSRSFDKYDVVTVIAERNDRKQFVDCKFPSGDAPTLPEGAPVKVQFSYLPDARGYESGKENPNTGKPYINAVVSIWKPTIDAVGVTPAKEDLSDDLPW